MPGYRCVIAGVHDSPAGARAVEVAGLLAAETEATLVLVAAYPAESDGGVDDPYQAGDVVAAQRVLKASAQRCQQMGAGYVPTFAVAGDTVTVLADAVSDHQADLLLVGSHGLPGMAGRLLPGGPLGVESRNACDVLVVHTTTKRWRRLTGRRFRHARSGGRRSVMVGVGDSLLSMRAVEQGAGIAAAVDANLILVGYRRSGVGAIEDILQNGEARARRLGAKTVISIVVRGDAVSGLLDAVEEHQADLLVLGDRQFTDGRLLDCVGAQVTHSTPTHVLLVH